jgi:hypothetical protein
MLRSGGIEMDFPIHLQSLERSFSAYAAARRCIKVTFKPLQVEVAWNSDGDRGIGALRYFLNGVPVIKDTLRVKETNRAS